MNERLAMTEAQLDMTKDDLKVYKEMTHDLQKQVLILRNPPWTFACGSHYAGIMATSMAISYSKLLYSSSNVEGAGLDICSVQVTPVHTLLHWVFRLGTILGMDSWTFISGRMQKLFYIGSEGYLEDKGDTLDLYCQDCSAGIYRTVFCVSLSVWCGVGLTGS